MPDSPPPSPLDAEAHRWLDALAVRIDDDPDLLDALPDAAVDRALAETDVRASTVRAAIRRQLREAPRADRPPVRRRRTLWPAALAVAVAVAVAVAAAVGLWTVLAPGDAAAPRTGLGAFQPDLQALVVPRSKALGSSRDALAEGAAALLAADSLSGAPRADAAQRAARAFGRAFVAARLEPEPGATRARATAAFFAAQAQRVREQPALARAWLRRVPPDGLYGPEAAALARSL